MKRDTAYSILDSEALGHGETDMKIILHHDLASPEVSNNENPGTLLVAKLPFRSDEVNRYKFSRCLLVKIKINK